MNSETTNKLQQIVEQNLINIEEAKEQGSKGGWVLLSLSPHGISPGSRWCHTLTPLRHAQ
jgi:hypothetical protein